MATSADRAFLQKLSEVSFARYAHRPRALMDRMFRGGGTLVAEHRGVRLGFAVADVSPPLRAVADLAAPRLAYLAAIAVVPEAKGIGLGRELLEAVEDYARREGAVSMRLMTATDNAAARRLFEGAGYSPLLPVADAYIDQQDAIEMWKSLSLART